MTAITMKGLRLKLKEYDKGQRKQIESLNCAGDQKVFSGTDLENDISMRGTLNRGFRIFGNLTGSICLRISRQALFLFFI
jgi:hypothetical protein